MSILKTSLMALAAGGALAATAAVPTAGAAEPLKFESGGAVVQLRLSASAQTGEQEDGLTPRADEPEAFQANARLTADWTTESGRVFGFSIETSSEDRETEALNTGEIYAYVASDFGRLEIGKQDGAADTLSYRAPVVALGQVRGDFARYAGASALLSAYDTGDAPKITYLSPPMGGLRVGISYAPEDERDDGGMRQENAVELGAQYERPAGDWIVGASAGWVQAEADPGSGRQDIRSWSAGLQARRGPIRIGVGYVDRGDSNQLLAGYDQTEWSAGVAWVEDRWGLAGSLASSEAKGFENRLIGVGGYYDLTDWVTLRADLVRIDMQRGLAPREDGLVFVAELEFHY